MAKANCNGQRMREVGLMSWSELQPPKWRLPAARTKNKRDHELTLPGMAWDIIEQVKRGPGFLFGRKAGFTNWDHAKKALDQRSGVTDWTIHDLRRTCATGMANLGEQPHIIEAVLNHISAQRVGHLMLTGHRAGVAGVYNRSSYEREVRNALALWADHVNSITQHRKEDHPDFSRKREWRAGHVAGEQRASAGSGSPHASPKHNQKGPLIMPTLSIPLEKGLLELATNIKRLIDEAKRLGDIELLFDLELELDEIEDAMHRAYRVRL